MKSQPCKKTTLKLHLNRNTISGVPSLPHSQGTNTTGCTSSSSKKTLSDPCDPTKSQLIQYLLQENIQLQRQNEDKEQLINFLSSGRSPKRRLILNTERSTEIKNQKLPQIKMEGSTPFCFTFCQTQSHKNVKVNKLPKEFQIVPNKKRYFI